MRATLSRMAPWIALLALASFHASFAERDRPLFLDQRYYVHFAQRIADGAVPHRDLFDNKPELASVLAAPAALAGDALGVDRIRAVRLFSIAVAAATGGALYAVVATAWASPIAGALGVLCWTAAPLLGFQPSIGPVPKLWMTLLGWCAALLAHRGRWFAAGVVAAAAALDWQIGFLAGVGILAAAACERVARSRAIAAVVAGGAATLAVTAALLAAGGALRPAFEQTVLASLARGGGSVGRRGAAVRLGQLVDWLGASGAASSWLAIAGVVSAAATFAWLWRWRGRAALRVALPVAILGWGVVGFSLLDFQGYGDLYVLLASLAMFAGLGAGALERTLRAVEPFDGAAAAALLLALALAAHPWHPAPVVPEERVFPGGVGLDMQREAGRRLASLAAGRRFGFAGCSEQLSLSGVANAFSSPFWNRATWAYFRRGPDESSGRTLLRVAEEARVDGVVCPPAEASDELAARGWTRRVIAMPPTRYEIDVFLRPQAAPDPLVRDAAGAP